MEKRVCNILELLQGKLTRAGILFVAMDKNGEYVGKINKKKIALSQGRKTLKQLTAVIEMKNKKKKRKTNNNTHTQSHHPPSSKQHSHQGLSKGHGYHDINVKHQGRMFEYMYSSRYNKL